MEAKAKMGDAFVSVEHLVLALADDARFAEALFKTEGLTKSKLEDAVKEVRIGFQGLVRGSGGVRAQVLVSSFWLGGPGVPELEVGAKV